MSVRAFGRPELRQAPMTAALDAARGIMRTYLSREQGMAYNWPIGVAALLAVGMPACLGVALGHRGDGIFTAMSAWLIMRSTPRGDTRKRAGSLIRHSVQMAAGVALGMLAGGWAALPLVALASLIAPVRGIGPFPALTLVIGARSSGHGWWIAALLFLLGGLFATAILLIPFFGGKHDPPQPRNARPPLKQRLSAGVSNLRTAARGGDPRFRHAVRLCACVSGAYTLITATGLPDGQLVIIGIVTTLRPSWGQTTNRIVKRVGGTTLGSLLAALLLALAAGQSPYTLMVAVAILSGLGQPLRRINYGFWPVFSGPVALLLSDTNGSIGWIQALERSTYNAAGALIAALATLLIWPAREQDRVPDHLAAVLEAHARLLERAATLLTQPEPPTAQRLHTRARAEAAAQELGQAGKRLALQPRPPRALIDALRQIAADAEELRGTVRTELAHRPPEDLAVPETLTDQAELLRHTAAGLEIGLPDNASSGASGHRGRKRSTGEEADGIPARTQKLAADATSASRLALASRPERASA